MNKAAIREFVRAKRPELDARLASRDSRKIQDRVFDLQEVQAARLVALYMAVQGEVQTDRLARRCRERGIALCVPALRREAGAYGLARWDERTRLAKGLGGIPEPAAPDWVALDDVDAVVVPGLAFDADGGRLGHGRGHYDRLLSGMRGPATRIGVCFEWQVVDRVPMDENDVRMDRVVTEKRMMTATAGSRCEEVTTR